MIWQAATFGRRWPKFVLCATALCSSTLEVKATAMPKSSQLTNRDHDNMEAFLSHVLDDFKAGDLSKKDLTLGLVQVISAIDCGNVDEARTWFEQGRKLIRQGS